MFLHDIRLAFRSLKRNPVLSALMILTIAVGIASSMIAITLYHARAGHPIPWKESKLFAVTLDIRDDEPDQGFSKHPEYPPFQLAYKDAEVLYRSDIPRYSVMMYRTGRLLSPPSRTVKPFDVSVRVTTADFFAMFDVPFQYGGGWPRTSDTAPDNVVVLSKYVNDKLFGGENSVGKEIVLNGQAYRVVGVLPAWMPQPRYYDLNFGNSFDIPEDIFMPFGWTQALHLNPNGINCISRNAKIQQYESLFTEDCVWLNYWVQLDSPDAHARYQQFVDNYATDQKRYGRFPRPQLNNRIVDVNGWLEMNDVIGDNSRMQVGVSVAFLAVCVLNIFGLMLAKFLSAAPIAGIRRALGASRVDIVRQHLIEVVVVGLIGGAVGLMLSFGGLALLRVTLTGSFFDSDNPARTQLAQSLSHMDFPMLLLATALSLVTGILAGIYPAWRIGRLTPATFLKTQ